MKYIQSKCSDYDKSVKLNNQLCLCYSPKLVKKLNDGDVEILGEVIKGESKKDPVAKLSVENKLIPVYENGTFNKLLYKKSYYIAVENSDGYIAVLNNRLPLLLWLLGLIVALVISLVLLFNKPDIDPLNALPPVDTNIEAVSDNSEKNSEPTDGGGKVGISYKTEAFLNLSTKEIEMEYKNPSISSHDVVLELCVVSDGKEYVVATSGRIPNGYQLTKMTLSNKAPHLSEGQYEAKFKSYYYDAETGEKALVSANIDNVTLTVTEK